VAINARERLRRQGSDEPFKPILAAPPIRSPRFALSLVPGGLHQQPSARNASKVRRT